MATAELLLLINTILTTVTGAMFLIMGYFLKDIHRDFKSLVEKVNQLYADLHSHISLAKQQQEEVKRLRDRMTTLEETVGDLR